LEQAGTKN